MDHIELCEILDSLVAVRPDAVITVPRKPWGPFDQLYKKSIDLKAMDIANALRPWGNAMPGSAVVNTDSWSIYRDSGLIQSKKLIIADLLNGGESGRWFAWMISEWHEGDPQDYIIPALLRYCVQSIGQHERR